MGAYMTMSKGRRSAPARRACVVADHAQRSAPRGFSKGAEMKLSARNQLKGKVAEITKGATTSHVVIDIGSGVAITASITNEAVTDLQLKKGDDAWAVIKASDVMIGK
jgi:molybdopterin-binding protein